MYTPPKHPFLESCQNPIPYGTDTNINGFQDCDNELTRLSLNFKFIETEKKLEFLDTKKSKILSKMLVHFEKNKDTILEMNRAFNI